MRLAAVSLVFLSAASAILSLPDSSSALARRAPIVEEQLPALGRRHGDDEDEDEEEMGHMHGMSETKEDAGDAGSAGAEPVKMEHSHGGEEHDHHSHGPALLVLNETQILLTHSPDPPSYFDFDQSEDGKPAVLYIHVFLMCLAYFVLLPLALFLKAGRSAISIIPQTAFFATAILGLIFGQAYNALTPSMYEKSSHTSWGWATVVLTIGLNAVDVGRFVLRFTRLGEKLESRFAGWKLAPREETDTEASPFQLGEDEEEQERLVASPVEMEHEHDGRQRWHSHSPERQLSRHSSALSDSDTVFDSAGPDAHAHYESKPPPSTAARLRRYGSLLFTFSERFLVVMAWIQVCTGVAVWTGTCRERYLNGCLAHVIKGSIFFGYGILTFARYLGAFSSLGWAWNRHPSKNNSIWTAEFVESLVIFVYGSTNTWMERFGKTGAWSVKDVQHTSIAILFWAAGALGMLLESRSVRAWLSASAAQASGRSLDQIPPPASASASFNVLPATCIGLIGIVMIEVHALWGYLLAAFALFRYLTYFFTFLRPPASILPSRPPTEALASIFLASGGLVFIESTEQVTFAAMRHGWDDMMAFLTLTVSTVVALFFWIAVLFAVKGWALKRNTPASSSSLRAAHAKSAGLA
ncbi:hypothetical protein JCM6882_004235 [Rhodosporidiobolus microsporus]